MTTSQTIHYQLGAPDDLTRLVDELAEIEAATVIIAFDSADPSFPTDLQLARLVGAGWDQKKQLVVETNDADLADRALMMGFTDAAVFTDSPEDGDLFDTRTIAPVIVARSDSPTPDTDFDTTANLATYAPATFPPSSESAGPQQQPWTQTGVIQRVDASSISTGPVSRSPWYGSSSASEAPTTHIGDQNRPKSPVSENEPFSDSSTNDREQPAETRTPRSRTKRRVLLAVAVIAPVIVIGVIAALAVYLLPAAQVRIVPQEEAVASSLTYGLAINDASYDVTIDPTTTSNTTTAEATREATGERYEPDGTAAGTLQVTNPLTSEVTVPAGTEIAGGNGVMYYTSEDLTIEAADPFGSMSFGSGSVTVYAGFAGPDGNLDAGTLTGQFGSGLFYTNTSAISGGTMRAISVIDEADVNAVVADVEEQLLDRAETEFMESIPPGHELVSESLEIGEP